MIYTILSYFLFDELIFDKMQITFAFNSVSPFEYTSIGNFGILFIMDFINV